MNSVRFLLREIPMSDKEILKEFITNLQILINKLQDFDQSFGKSDFENGYKLGQMDAAFLLKTLLERYNIKVIDCKERIEV